MRATNTIQIHATSDTIWTVATDIERWPEWTPTVFSAKRLDDGPFAVGSVALLKQPGLPEARWTVTELADGSRFVWESRVRGIQMIATHEVAETKAGAESRLSFETKGVFAALLWPLIGSAIKRAIEKENSSLKRFCEKKSANGAQASD